MKPSDALENGSSLYKMQNLDMVDLKCVTYAEPIFLSVRAHHIMTTI